MTKKEYIKRQIAKTNKKDYENYVITRIIHKLDDLEVKFVTQQYVKRPEGRALADLYFPQINYFVEVDEGHHLTQVELDKVRDADFEDATGIIPERINVENNSIEEIHKSIDKVVHEIKTLVKKSKRKGTFIPWDIEKEFDPHYWISKGLIKIEDKVAFRTSVDACRCMGLNYAGFQRGGARHPYEANTLIWFPKLYPNRTSDNNFDESSGIISEKNIENKEKSKKHIDQHLEGSVTRRIVFARVKSMLGDINYRFRGVFELDKKASNYKVGLIWNRVDNKVKTYDYRNK